MDTTKTMTVQEIEGAGEKTIDENSWAISTSVELVRGTAGWRGRRSVQETLAAYGTNPWFRAVVERVAFAAASVPWRLFAVRGKSKSFERHMALQTCESPEAREKLLGHLEARGRLVEITEHLLLDTLAEPNPHHTGVDMRLLTFATLIVAGEIGWALGKNGMNAPSQIWPIPPHWIIKHPYGRSAEYHVMVGGKAYSFSEEEFVLFRNPALVNPYGTGTGIGTTLTDELEVDEYIAKFQGSFFHSHGRPDLLVTAKGASQDELKAQKDRFENEYRDARKGGRSMWVRGDIDIKELSQKLVDLDLTKQREWIKDLARQVIGAPPEVMADVKTSNRATAREALAILAIMVTVPQLERLRAQAQMKVVPLYDKRLVLGYWSPVPDDEKFQLQAVKVAPWAATRGEIRKLQGLEDRGEPDNKHLMPIGVELIEGPPLPRERTARTHRELIEEAQAPPMDADAKDLTDSGVDRLVSLLTPELLDLEVTPEVERTIEEWGNRTLSAIGVAPGFDMLNPLVTEYISRFRATEIKRINDVTKKRVRAALIDGVRAGEGADELARRLRDRFSQFNIGRAANIARTEVTAATGFSTWGAHKMSGVVDKRRWIAVDDGRGDDRPIVHMVFHALPPVGIDQPFAAGGYIAMYPGNFDDPAMDCSCRCATGAIIEEPKGARLVVVKGRREDAEKYEEHVAVATRRAFDAQRDILLANLRRLAA